MKKALVSADVEKRNIELASALASDLLPIQDILKSHDMTQRELDALLVTPSFRRLLLAARNEWQSATNAAERARIKSAMGFETSIPELVRSIHRHNEPLSGRVEAAKLLARASGIGERANIPTVGGEKFSVVINLTGEAPHTISKPLSPSVVISSDPEDR